MPMSSREACPDSNDRLTSCIKPGGVKAKRATQQSGIKAAGLPAWVRGRANWLTVPSLPHYSTLLIIAIRACRIHIPHPSIPIIPATYPHPSRFPPRLPRSVSSPTILPLSDPSWHRLLFHPLIELLSLSLSLPLLFDLSEKSMCSVQRRTSGVLARRFKVESMNDDAHCVLLQRD
ncbi:hypothetical protein BKA81DRAFT_54608 [Phyllosticta paracitricarpa]